YQTDAEYEEHFLELFKQAVKVSLCRSDKPVWAELSGGLDSTSIVCMADKLVEEGDLASPKVKTVSHFTKGTLNSDEGKYIHWVEEQRGIMGYHQYLDDYTMRVIPPEEKFQSHLTTGLLYPRGLEALRTEMKNAGARILLSGHGGDQLLWAMPSAAPELSDSLYRFKLLQLHRRLLEWSRILEMPYTSLFRQQALLPLLPNNLRTRYCDDQAKPPQWLDSKFVKHMGIRHRNSFPADPFGYSLP